MTPLSPEIRSLLKQAHPALTDSVIDRSEALLLRSTELDPARDAPEIARLERDWERLVERHMPAYGDIVAAANRRSPPDRDRILPLVTFRARDDERTSDEPPVP